MSQGTCYVCATPIGHLEDCTFRLIDTLKSVDLIAAEDTRVSRKLLERYHIRKPVISLQKFNEKERANTIVLKIQEGQDVAVLSDAGTPNICDPGAHLIQLLYNQSCDVKVIPGPSALTAFLSISGVVCNQFIFGGFFPKKRAESEMICQKITDEMPIVFFETGKRIQKTMIWLNAQPWVKFVVLGKELTKCFEHITAGSDLDVIIQKLDDPLFCKGEWCMLLQCQWESDQAHLRKRIDQLRHNGFSLTEVLKIIGIMCPNEKRNDVYRIFHELKT